MIAGIPLGWGIMIIFMQGIQYLIEVYTVNAASAMSANTIVRSLAGGGFPLFAAAMYDKLGVDWATSLLGFLCVGMILGPVGFYLYGDKVRAMSRYGKK